VNARIPLYTADGALAEWISPQRLARLEADGMIRRVIKHPKGHVCRAYLSCRSGEGRPIELYQYLGTRYSFRERLPAGYLSWTLRRLPTAWRPFFLATVLERCRDATRAG